MKSTPHVHAIKRQEHSASLQATSLSTATCRHADMHRCASRKHNVKRRGKRSKVLRHRVRVPKESNVYAGKREREGSTREKKGQKKGNSAETHTHTHANTIRSHKALGVLWVVDWSNLQQSSGHWLPVAQSEEHRREKRPSPQLQCAVVCYSMFTCIL